MHLRAHTRQLLVACADEVSFLQTFSGPHLGHHHTVVFADTLHRLNRLLAPKQPTIFSTGTDEHGLKVYFALDSALVV